MPKMRSSAGKTSNRRGSPEAVEKRRVARLFNDVLRGRASSARPLDGRTEKRRQRLLREVAEGQTASGRALKPIEVLQHVQELFDLGETVASLKKSVKIRTVTVAATGIEEVVRRLHRAYAFAPEAYRFVGVSDDVLRASGILGETGRRPRAKKRAKASS